MYAKKLAWSAVFCLSIGTGCIEDPGSVRTAITDQQIDTDPFCPEGDTFVIWDDPYGNCGSCVISGQDGELANRYKSCSSAIIATAKLLDAHACALVCD